MRLITIIVFMYLERKIPLMDEYKTNIHYVNEI